MHEFVKTFTDPASGRQIVAIRRDLRKYGPAVIFSTRMADGEFMDRVYYAGDASDEAVAALDAYFTDLTEETAVYQIGKTIAEHAINGETGEKPEEIAGTGGGENLTVSASADNPEDV